MRHFLRLERTKRCSPLFGLSWRSDSFEIDENETQKKSFWCCDHFLPGINRFCSFSRLFSLRRKWALSAPFLHPLFPVSLFRSPQTSDRRGTLLSHAFHPASMLCSCSRGYFPFTMHVVMTESMCRCCTSNVCGCPFFSHLSLFFHSEGGQRMVMLSLGEIDVWLWIESSFLVNG